MSTGIFTKLQSSIKFFNDFTLGEIEQIFKVAPRKVYRKGDYVYRNGSIGNELYIILSGSVQVTEYSDNIEYDRKDLGYGDIFGASSFILKKPHTEDVVVKEDRTTVIIISEFNFSTRLTVIYRLFKTITIELSDQTKRQSRRIADYKVESVDKKQGLNDLIEKAGGYDFSFKGTSLTKNNFSNQTFTQNKFSETSFSRSDSSDVTFSNCILEKSDWSNMKGTDITFRSSSFISSNFLGFKSKEATFINCHFSKANFDNAIAESFITDGRH